MSELTNDDRRLIQWLMKGERGLANYGCEEIGDDLMLDIAPNGDVTSYEWNEATKIWHKFEDEATTQNRFFGQLSQTITELTQKVVNMRPKLDDEKMVLKLLSDGEKMCGGIVKMKLVFSFLAGLVRERSKGKRAMNNYPDALPLKGGKKVCLRTGKISDRTRDDLWSFEIAATADEPTEQGKADALQFVRNICKRYDGTVDEGRVNYHQTLGGYWMTLEIGDKAVYFLCGVSNSGKSVLMNQFARVLKDRVGPCSADVFIASTNGSNHLTYLVSLHGKSMVFCQELPAGRQLNADMVKKLTGGDPVEYRRSNAKKGEILINLAKLVCTGNDRQRMDGGDTGLQTRARMLPFEFSQVKVSKAEQVENSKLLKRLETQDGTNALFRFWLEGAMRYYAQLEEHEYVIEPPACVLDENEEFMAGADSFQSFVEARCEVWTPECNEAKENFTFERRDLQRMYRSHCLDNGVAKEQILDTSSVSGRIKALLPFQKPRGAYLGIRRKEGWQPEM